MGGIGLLLLRLDVKMRLFYLSGDIATERLSCEGETSVSITFFEHPGENLLFYNIQVIFGSKSVTV
jgi:hypothetical protein